MRLRTCGSPPWPGSASAMMNGRKSTLGGSRPAAEVDGFDAHPLHRHGLAGRVGAEGGDALLLIEQLAQAPVERLSGAASDGVVRADGAALLHHLARGVDG